MSSTHSLFLRPSFSARATAALFAVSIALGAPLGAAEIFTVDAGRGPVDVQVPSSYDPDVPTPLLLLLHGYSSSGALQELYMRFGPVAEERGLLYAYPDGTRDFLGLRFWNATDACCDFFGSNVDDAGYLLDLIEAIGSLANVDPTRIYITGHSNGGFMSYRMACDHADKIAAIASLAGATYEDADDCSPSEPVHQLQIHGTLDEVILFDGGCLLGGCYPSAIDSTKQWAAANGCARQVDLSAPNLDLDTGLAGAETVVGRVDEGCLAGGSAELWVIRDGLHTPELGPSYAAAVVDYLMRHPKTR